MTQPSFPLAATSERGLAAVCRCGRPVAWIGLRRLNPGEVDLFGPAAEARFRADAKRNGRRVVAMDAAAMRAGPSCDGRCDAAKAWRADRPLYRFLDRLAALARTGRRLAERRQDLRLANVADSLSGLEALADPAVPDDGDEDGGRASCPTPAETPHAAGGGVYHTPPSWSAPMAEPQMIDYRRPTAVSMTQPAVPLTAVTIGVGSETDPDEVWEHGRSVLAVVALVEDVLQRPRRSATDAGNPAAVPTPESLREEGYRPHRFADGLDFDYLVEGEFGPQLFHRFYADGGNCVYRVVPTASLPLRDALRKEMVKEAREKTAVMRQKNAATRAAGDAA